MKVTEHPIISDAWKTLELSFGNFYFFDQFVVGEIHEEEHFNWAKAKIVIDYAEKLYGENFKPCYISNRIHDYSIAASDWLTFFKNRYSLRKYIIVSDKVSSQLNLNFEKLFIKETSLIYKAKNLDEALACVKKILQEEQNS